MLLTIGLTAATAGELPPVKTVFVVVMENQWWREIKANASAPFINSVLLPAASYCENYYFPPGLGPSLPNYLWLEAGTNFGVFNDDDPALNHLPYTNHLTTQLFNAGISWRTYQEDIPGTCVPLTATNGYVPKHNPFVYFDDVTGTNSPTYPYGLAHIRPFTEFASDLASNTVARYNFITPNICNDMHDSCTALNDRVKQGDDWLAAFVPPLLASQAYRDNGALFVIWDEGDDDVDVSSIPMILLSPLAKGGGYASTNYYTHSSLLRTWQEIFGVGPLLGDAANVQNLSELFLAIKLSCIEQIPSGVMELTASGVQPGRMHVFESSTNLVDWVPISTNYARSNEVTITDYSAPTCASQFYRVRQIR